MVDKRKEFGQCIRSQFQKAEYKNIKPHKLKMCMFAKICRGKFTKFEDARNDCLKAHPDWKM